MAKLSDLKPGTLVRIADWALNERYHHGRNNRRCTEKFGYLWFVIEHNTQECAYCVNGGNIISGVGQCGHTVQTKSLATGDGPLPFFTRELEVVDGKTS